MQIVHPVLTDLEETGDIAAGAVDAVRPANDDHADLRIVIHGSDDGSDLRARPEADHVHRRPVEDEIAGSGARVLFPAQTIKLGRVTRHLSLRLLCNSHRNAPWPSQGWPRRCR